MWWRKKYVLLEDQMIEAVALRGVLTLYYDGQQVDINLDGLCLGEVLNYVRRKTGLQINLIAGRL